MRSPSRIQRLSTEVGSGGSETIPVESRTEPVPFGDAFDAYLKLREHFGSREVFLLESQSGPASVSRRTTIGFGPLFGIRLHGRRISWHGDEQLVAHLRRAVAGGDLFDPADNRRSTLLASRSGIWDLVRRIRDTFTIRRDDGPPQFRFGFFGYFGYDMAWSVERLPQRIPPANDHPCLDLTVYQGLVEYDLRHREARLVVNRNPHWPDPGVDALRGLLAPIAAATGRAFEFPPAPAPHHVIRSLRDEDYLPMVDSALEHILAGDIYQVQLGHDVTVRTTLDPLDAYRRLRARNPSPYGYLAPFGPITVLGASPELFIRFEDGLLTMKPIAGTAPRWPDPAEDQAVRERLRGDEKEIAEHIMLVDLCRNDIGRICRVGTLDASDLMHVEAYSHVYHLVSTVTGNLAEGDDEYDVIRACFPAGTMTGAPKIRAMEIIEELERTRRGVYAGALGLVDFGGGLNLALCIRGAVHEGDGYVVRASAGVVADSDPRREWAETWHKLGAVHWALTGRETDGASTAD